MSGFDGGLPYDDDGDVAPPGPGRVVPAGPIVDGPIDLTTRYLGLRLRSPIVASASPLTGDLSALRALDAAGVGAVVLPSLFEEQITHEAVQVDRMVESTRESHPEAAGGYVPRLDAYNDGVDHYVDLVSAAKQALDVPVIASLNGTSEGGWARYARLLEEAGADAVELNVYRVAASPDVEGREIEQETLALISTVRDSVEVPVAVKVGPHWSAFGSFAGRMVDAGADGLVLFNRFYQPDIDLETLSVRPQLTLSVSEELLLPLRWCALLHSHLGASLAATTGVHTGRDVAKVLLAGADVAMTTSALLRNGPAHVAEMEEQLRAMMAECGYGSSDQMRGAVSQGKVADPAAYERANYLGTLTHYASTFRI